MPAIVDAIRFLDSIGLVDVLLPFVLVFTIVYGMLERTRVLGDIKGQPRRPLNAMVAFVLGFMAVASVQTIGVVHLLSQVAAVSVIVIIVLLMLSGLLGVNDASKSPFLMGVGVLVCIVGILMVLANLDLLPTSFGDIDARFGVIFLFLLVLFVGAWFITSAVPAAKKEEAKPATPPKNDAKTKKLSIEEANDMIQKLAESGLIGPPQGPPPQQPPGNL